MEKKWQIRLIAVHLKESVTEEKESVDTAGCYRSSCVVNGLVKLFYVRCNQCGISDTAGNRTDRINYGR